MMGSRQPSSNSSLGEHVNVSRPFKSSDHPMSQSYSEDSSYVGPKSSAETIMSQSMVHEPRDSRSIEESLALIQHHVKGLNESQMYGGVPPPPPSEQPTPIPAGCPSVAPYLAPPPGFSDS